MQQAAWAAVNQGCAEARGTGLTHPGIEAKRLAWAMAVRVSSELPEQSYLGRVGGDRTVSDLASQVRMADLAWAVACEQAPDGFTPEADATDAKAAFEALVRRDRAYVAHFARTRLKDRAAADAAADDAWQAFFFTYCRPGAPRRFLALSAIPSVLCTIIRRLAIKRGHGDVSLDAEINDDGETLAATLAVDRSPGPGAGASGEELRRLVLEAIETLPARQGLVTSLHLVHGLAQIEVADRLGCSRAYVSQTLSTTLGKVREFLASRGWGPGRGPTPRENSAPTLTRG